MFLINFIEYTNDKYINYGFNSLDNKNINNYTLDLLTKHIYDAVLKTDIFKNNNICIFNFNKNKQLSITSCIQDNINFTIHNIQDKINDIIKNIKSNNTYNVITFKINMHCLDDIIDNNFCIKIHKHKCSSEHLKKIINVY
tara:strand:+ start:60 stop:482 length:423 start_codon:yes stop_codon:yes gene_type:complete